MPAHDASPHAQPSHEVLKQAAHWYALLRDGKAGRKARNDWQAWLQAHETHQAAWHQVESISRHFDPLRGQPEARLAVETLGTANRYLQTRRRMLASVAVLTGSSLCAWLSWRNELLPASVMAWGADHRTGVGEQREIRLADGSRLWLNTASAINVRMDEAERSIELVEGEIFIDTAKDALRPFYVQTRFGRLQALGTRFNVRLDHDRTRLAVYEGAVEIRAGASGALRRLHAGQQAHFSADSISDIETADSALEAWTQGALVADNLPLAHVVKELRRYRRGYLGVADEVADIKVYGNFPIQDPDRVLHMLASVLPIRIEQPLPWWTHIEARR